MRPRLSLIAIAVGAAALVALLAIGCGGSNNSSSGAPNYGNATSSTAASTGAGAAATVAVADNPKLGQILVDGDSHTLYLFEKDKGNQSYCNGSCAKVWPPYTTKGAPKAGQGADASKLGTLKRSDGSTQVTYNGMPLYAYVDDSKSGDTKGNGLDQFGAEWYALHPTGEKAEAPAGAGGKPSAGSSSGGYSY